MGGRRIAAFLLFKKRVIRDWTIAPLALPFLSLGEDIKFKIGFFLCLMTNSKIRLELVLFFYLLLPLLICSAKHGNPANDIVNIINQNRTAHKLTKLSDSPGLGCMALQYVELCKGNCSNDDAVKCKPPEDDFTEVFAPNCGVELPTFGTITGQIVGCRYKYVKPELAFSDVLVKDGRTLSLLRNRSHKEVGVGMMGFPQGPFFWCVLFSDGGTNSTFVLGDSGRGIKQKKGCYSGSNFPCSGGGGMTSTSRLSNLLSIAVSFFCLHKHLYRR